MTIKLCLLAELNSCNVAVLVCNRFKVETIYYIYPVT